MGDDGDQSPAQRKVSLAKVLQHGADPNALSLEDPGQKRTLLCLAIEEAVQLDNFERVDLLLEAKADVNRKSETGDFPLLIAVRHSQVPLARKLLQRKADANLQDNKLVAPLHMAVYEDDARMMQLLVMHRGNVNITDRLGQTPAFFASSSEAMSVLLEAGADLLHLNHKGQCALHRVAYGGATEAVEFLLGYMSHLVDMPDESGRTPLHHAAMKGHQDVVKLLLDLGADASLKTKNGNTAMTLADKENTNLSYYIYCRTTGSNRSTWREMCSNPLFMLTVAILGSACIVQRRLFWDLTMDMLYP